MPKAFKIVLRVIALVIGLIALSGVFIPYCPSGHHRTIFTCEPK
jgi:hypothetical protein